MGLDDIYRTPGSNVYDVDFEIKRLSLLSRPTLIGLLSDDGHEPEEEDFRAYSEDLARQITSFLPNLAGSSHDDICTYLSEYSPIEYILAILKSGIIINNQYGYGSIAAQCEKNIRIIRNEIFNIDGIPLDYWGNIPDVNGNMIEDEYYLYNGVFYRAYQMASGRTRIAPIDWSMNLAQDKFFYAVRDMLNRYKTNPQPKKNRLSLFEKIRFRYFYKI
ncbi:hypothetical protein NBRC3280_3035 [Acetobacter pasteurianus NBRC 3280]|uniref:Uncharacterized protein n=1 Tax=Acetobacter pasteurianus NBRC 3278 TaxID=1226660 RepID=A0A401X8B0_ACEPA|nr:hypothetical protein [Acetobacter pasteurianus]GCD60404.1 hypothetical protein NBRC3277_2979 [Acetobacter pasteurianus NBRC 3277]GCD63967.1 hypothetical protein NBRC3278_3060 [Acetobacter pasteurianus NBRC 3278]GCD70400.1 hypothetical protein NBRC3280_3035 [Acetobacter pasteurianus NBRC 3280]